MYSRKCIKCGGITSVIDRHSTEVLCEECSKLLSKENLEDLAINKWYSSGKIAQELGFGVTTIKRYLARYKIFEKKAEIRKNNSLKAKELYQGERSDKYQKVKHHCFNCEKEVIGSKFTKYVLCEECKKIPKHLHKKILVQKVCRICGDIITTNLLNVRPKCDECKRKGLVKHDYIDHFLSTQFFDQYELFIKNSNGKKYLSFFECQIDLEKEKDEKLIYVGSTKNRLKWFCIDLQNGHSKIPDFIKVDEDFFKKYNLKELDEKERHNLLVEKYLTGELQVKKVVECNGIYWHRIEHPEIKVDEYIEKSLWKQEEEKMVEKYKNIGIDCLVVWDFQYAYNKEGVLEKIQSFIF